MDEKTEEKVEKLKILSLANNIHKLNPPKSTGDQAVNVEIIEALKADPMIIEVQLELKGMGYDPELKKWVSYRNPVMNSIGIGNFIQTIKSIAKTIEYSNFDKDDIPMFATHEFKTNYPYFTIYHDDYELDKKDFNLIATILFNFIISAFNKAKGAGHRNVVRGVYSEETLGKIIKGNESQIKKEGFLSGMAKFNPLKKRS